MRERIPIFRDHHRFDVEMLEWNDPNFGRWCRRRIERLEVGEKIAKRISHRLEDERRSVMLRSVKILARELTDSHGEPFVEGSLFNPPGIEAERVGACHPTGTR